MGDSGLLAFDPATVFALKSLAELPLDFELLIQTN
jgi:hypothetical protein